VEIVANPLHGRPENEVDAILCLAGSAVKHLNAEALAINEERTVRVPLVWSRRKFMGQNDSHG
jgi:hypothetical protein